MNLEKMTFKDTNINVNSKTLVINDEGRCQFQEIDHN